MNQDREIEYLHMRCNNLNDRLTLALNVINEMINMQTQKLNPYHPEGGAYQGMSDNCFNTINGINNEWVQVESEYQDVISNNQLTQK